MKEKLVANYLAIVNSLTTYTTPYGSSKSEARITIYDDKGGEVNVDIPITKIAHLIDVKTLRYKLTVILEPVENDQDFVFEQK